MNKLLIVVVASCLVSMAAAQVNINFNFNNEQNFAQNFEQLGNIFSNWNQVFNFWQSQLTQVGSAVGSLWGIGSRSVAVVEAKKQLTASLATAVQTIINLVGQYLTQNTSFAQPIAAIYSQVINFLNGHLQSAISALVDAKIQAMIQH